MIKTKDVLRFSELKLMLADARKSIRKLEAEEKDLEQRLIGAVKENQRTESACPFKLQIETVDKRYQPAYKQCAIDLSSELEVTEWVENHNPHDKEDKLALVPKMVTAVRMSKPVQAVMDALRKAAG